MVQSPPAKAGDPREVGLIPGLERSPGVGNGNPFQCSCLENSKNRGAWWVTIAKRGCKELCMIEHTHIYW